MDVSLLNNQLPKTDRQFESLWARTPWIEVKHSAARLLFWYVTVPEDHDAESGRFGLQVELPEVMEHVEGSAIQLDGLSLGQPARPRALVNVAAHRRHWRNRGEFLENFGSAHIPGMNDVFGTTQRVKRFRAEQAVRVGNDTDEDGDLSSQCSVLVCDWRS